MQSADPNLTTECTDFTLGYSSTDDGSDIVRSVSSSDVSRLPQVLDLTQATNLHEQMKALIGTGTIRLDAADVVSMSTPCVQVLLATACAAQSSNATFQIINASAAFEAAIADLGLRSHFNSWVA